MHCEFNFIMGINSGLEVFFLLICSLHTVCNSVWVSAWLSVSCISVSAYVCVPGIMWHLQNWNSSHTTLHKRLSVFLSASVGTECSLFSSFHWSRWLPNKYTPSFWLQLSIFQRTNHCKTHSNSAKIYSCLTNISNPSFFLWCLTPC